MQCSVAANLSGAEFAASLWFAIQQKLQTWQLDYSQLQVYVIFKRSGLGLGATLHQTSLKPCVKKVTVWSLTTGQCPVWSSVVNVLFYTYIWWMSYNSRGPS